MSLFVLVYSEILQECIKRMRELGIQLLRAISKTLGFEECYIEKRMKLESGHDFISANDYPLRLYSENQLGQPPHYDTGLLVLLLPGESNGLQLEHHGKWINVNPQPNSIVVIIADHIEVHFISSESLSSQCKIMPHIFFLFTSFLLFVFYKTKFIFYCNSKLRNFAYFYCCTDSNQWEV